MIEIEQIRKITLIEKEIERIEPLILKAGTSNNGKCSCQICN